MGFSLCGLLLLSVAARLATLTLAAGLVGVGSAVFHPESSRVARLASGGRHGLAQSVFQVGGNVGSSLGPLLAAFLVLPHGQSSIAWASSVALVAIGVLWYVGGWYGAARPVARPIAAAAGAGAGSTTVLVEHHPRRSPVSPGKIRASIAILIALIFSKYFYLASLTSYYTFYLINKFNVSVQAAQIDLFVFLGAAAAGTILGGPIGDRFGRKLVIWVSIVGVFRHHRLRSGTDAGANRSDLRPLLRIRIRHGRPGCGCPRPSRGCDEHRLRVQTLLVPSADRAADRFPAEPWEKRIVIRTVLACVLAAISCAIVVAQTTTTRTATTLFEGARLITGDGRLIEDGGMLVDGDSIVRVGKRGEVSAPNGSTRIDLTGKTIIPGMVLAHGHVGYLRGTTFARENYTRENLIDHLTRYLYYGVVAMMSTGTDPGDV